jgi:hypothetical protein
LCVAGHNGARPDHFRYAIGIVTSYHHAGLAGTTFTTVGVRCLHC